MTSLKHRLERLEKTNKIDGLEGNVTHVLDLFNEGVKKRKEKAFEKDMNDRNLYYWKLWVKALEEKAKHG